MRRYERRLHNLGVVYEDPAVPGAVSQRGGRLPALGKETTPNVERVRQLLRGDFSRDFLRTEASVDPGANDQTKVSPGSIPSTAAIGAGTVVRTEADLSKTLNALDSNDLATTDQKHQRTQSRRSVGRHEGLTVGINLKYSRLIALLVVQQMAELPRTAPPRELRALEMLRVGVRAAEGSTPGEFLVPSQSGKGFYRIRRSECPGQPETCECRDFLERNAPCKHVHFVRLWLKSPDQAVPPTLSQSPIQNAPKRNWSLYDRAQLEEGRLVRILLRDLTNGFPEPFKDPRLPGRKPVALRDQAFCAVQRS